MKTAKETFEKFDFKERKESYKNDNIIEIQYSNYEKGNWIIINQKSIEYVEKRTTAYLPIKLLQAINKQVEELGWNDESRRNK